MELTRAVGLGVFCVAGSAALHQGLHLCQGLLVARAGQKRRELTFVERLTFTCPSAYLPLRFFPCRQVAPKGILPFFYLMSLRPPMGQLC